MSCNDCTCSSQGITFQVSDFWCPAERYHVQAYHHLGRFFLQQEVRWSAPDLYECCTRHTRKMPKSLPGIQVDMVDTRPSNRPPWTNFIKQKTLHGQRLGEGSKLVRGFVKLRLRASLNPWGITLSFVMPRSDHQGSCVIG